MSILSRIMDDLDTAKERIDGALAILQSDDVTVRGSLSLSMGTLNVLIQSGLVPGAVIQLCETAKHYRFIGYEVGEDCNGLLACFQALDAEDLRVPGAPIKSDIETLLDRQNKWRFVKDEEQDKHE